VWIQAGCSLTEPFPQPAASTPAASNAAFCMPHLPQPSIQHGVFVMRLNSVMKPLPLASTP